MRTDFGLKPGDLEIICHILEKEPQIEQALLFGSRAKGTDKPGSDVDIALKGKDLNAQTITNVSYYLNEETPLPYRFDVLNYHTITERSLVEHIDRVGIEFYNKKTLHEII